MLDLELKNDVKTSEETSFESLIVDMYIENNDQEFDSLAQSYENCVTILNLVQKYGADNDVIKELVGDQITYSSQEDLEQQLEAACEGFFGKIKDAIAKKIAQSQGDVFDRAIRKLEKLSVEIDQQSRRVGRDVSRWATKGIKVPNIEKIAQSLRVIDNVGKLTEKSLTANHIKGMQTVVNYLKSDSTKVDAADFMKGDLKKTIPVIKDIQRQYLAIKQSLSGFIGAIERLPKGFSAKSSTVVNGVKTQELGYSKQDLMQYVTLAHQILNSIATAIVQFATGCYKAVHSAQKDDQFHEDQKKYFDKQ